MLAALLDDLVVRDLGCAPHVLARLVTELSADARSIRQVAQQLTPPQRHGLRPLPSPLPLVPAIEEQFADLALVQRDRELLLALALCLDDALDPIIAFDGRSAAEIASGTVARHVYVHAGRIKFTDPRLAMWVQGTTASAVHSLVHQRLSTVFRISGDRVSADWHRARAALHIDPEAARELTRIAQELAEAGHADRALLFAQEAAEHATGEDRDKARLVAGNAAVGAGFAAEAVAWLGGLFPDGAPERYRLQGLGGLIVAQAHLQGAVVDVDPQLFRPSTDEPQDWHAWSRAAALAAVLCAERGDRRRMRSWLDALRAGCSRVGAGHELRDPAVALCWLILGEGDTDDATGSGPLTGAMLRALRAALNDDIDLALRMLDPTAIVIETDPLIAGFEQSPLMHAYRAVLEVLLLVWHGDMGIARERLIVAAVRLPVAVPFAGLAVVLARRLDLAVLGELGPFALALTDALPSTMTIDLLVDRGIQAFLAGNFDDAAASIRLWLDRGAPQTVLAVPGLDEVALTHDVKPHAAKIIAPPEIMLAQALRVRVATTTDGRWRTERADVHGLVRTLRSPFARARAEMMLGIQAAIRDDLAAQAHLRAALNLFDLVGATAWARCAQERLARLEDCDSVASIDPLGACRRAWSQLLTAREVEVAMLAVAGDTNRAIADELNVSVRTVEVHLGRVFSKLDVRKRVELTALAHRTNQHL